MQFGQPKTLSQGLKPSILLVFCGPAKAMPFYGVIYATVPVLANAAVAEPWTVLLVHSLDVLNESIVQLTQ